MSDCVPIGPEVGSLAPDVRVSGIAPRAGHGEPRVLAFLRGGLDRELPEPLPAIRGELRGLGAELMVVSPGGMWRVGADDPVEPVAIADDALAREAAEAAQRYGVCDGDEAVFVIDGRGVVRFSHRLPPDCRAVWHRLATALAMAGRATLARDRGDPRQRVLFTRREWTVTCLVAGCAAAFLGCKEQGRQAPERRPPPADELVADLDITLRINGAPHRLTIDPRTSLLDALRERLGLTGTKKGCDAGQCGACTVLVDGKRVTSCLTLAVMVQNRDVTTIEGLARDGALHPMQAAFVAHDGLQCGFCTPGQIMSAVALIAEGHARSDDEVREQMSGNICRCGAYPNIIAAIQSVRGSRG